MIISGSDPITMAPPGGIPLYRETFQTDRISQLHARLENSPQFQSFCDYMDSVCEPERRALEMPRGVRQFMLDRGCVQMLQIFQGLELITRVEEQRGFTFDFVMRSRFDIVYPIDFCPVFQQSSSFLDRYFPHSEQQKQRYQDACRALHWNPTVYHMDTVPPLDPPTLRIPAQYWPVNFGGTYFLARQLPADTSTDSTARGGDIVYDASTARGGNILWCYNDFVLVGSRSTFFRFQNAFDMYDTDVVALAKDLGIYHGGAQEAQWIMFSHFLHVPIIMYLGDQCRMVR